MCARRRRCFDAPATPWRERAARQRGDLLEPHDGPGAALVSPEGSHGVMDGIAPQDLVLFSAASLAASLIAGLAGFAFGLVAAAIWLHLFFGNLACPSDLPGAQTRGIARRAILDSDRLFAWRLAARLSGPDCPPAKGLPEDTRRQLEQLAARGNKSTAAPAASPPDPIE
jgi:hypothetical protein